MTSTWPSPTQKSSERVRTKDMMSLDHSSRKDLGWVVQEQLQEVSHLLTSIETKLEVLSQVLWVKDSQELS